MSVISELIGGGGEAIGNMLVKVREAITGKTVLDQNEQAQIAAQLSELAGSLTSGQLKINEAEAANPNWFVAGWRPYIGWICGSGLLYQFLVRPLVNGFLLVFHQAAVFPSLDTATLQGLLVGMLGLTVSRSVDKYNGVQGNH